MLRGTTSLRFALSSALTAGLLAVVIAPGTADAAGNVSATLVNRTLLIFGDNGGNDIHLETPDTEPSGTVDLTGLAGTTINRAASERFFPVTRDIKIVTGDGANSFEFLNVQVLRKLSILSGNGDDTVTLNNTNIGDNFKFILNDGIANVTMDGVGSSKPSKIITKNADDTIDIINSQLRLVVVTKGGNDTVLIEATGTTNQGDIKVKTAGGDDWVELKDLDQVANKLILVTGSGDDHVLLDNIKVAKRAVVNGSADTDTLVDSDNHSGAGAFLIKGFEQ